MLRIVDYAKRKDIEWYEVIRQAINESSVAPVVILSQGELRVYELGEDEMIDDYPDAEPIPLALVECSLHPAFLARLVHARFPVIFKSVTKNKDDMATDFYQLDDMPIRSPAVSEYEGLDSVWFGFSKQVSMTLDDLWIPDDYQFNSQETSKQESEEVAGHKRQIKPHTKYIEHQIQLGKNMFNSWQFFRRLAAESRGSMTIELPGFGPIYLKQNPKDIKYTLLYSDTVFKNSTDGETVKKNSFDRAWRRISGHK
jgi:hypothetical protein